MTRSAPGLRPAFLLAPVLLAACPRQDPAPLPVLPGDARLVCDRDYFPAVRALIEEAESTLSVGQFSLYGSSATRDIEELLGAAAARGVRVRVLLDDEVEDNGPAVDRLQDAGVEARLDGLPSTTMHAKFLVADEGKALVGSTNWSGSSIDRNRECNLLLHGGRAPAAVAAWFDRLWSDARDRDRAPAELDVSGVLALTDDALLPSLLTRIGGASERIEFTMYATYLQPDRPDAPVMRIFSAFADAAARGVPVRGLVEWGRNDELNARNVEAVEWLEARGVDLRWEDPGVVTHAKVVRTDGVLQVQSANFSTSGMERNHEVGAATTLAGPLGAFEAWFEPLWEAGTEEPP